MKILLIGSGGQVGRALAGTVSAGHVLTCLDRNGLDICDADQVSRVVAQQAPDVIVNAAAYTAVDKAESEPDAAYSANRDAVGNLARAAAARGARMVHLSTDFVFDGRSGTPYEPGDRVSPVGVYGASKAAGEEAARQELPNALIVRTAWVYSAHGANFVKTMLRLFHERDEVRVVADQIGTPTHATSLARAIWGLIETGAGGMHHFTDAGVASWYDFAVAVYEEALAAAMLNRSVNIVPIATAEYPTPAQRPAYSVLDKAPTWTLLGGPAAHWRSELRSALQQIRDEVDA